MDGNIEYLGRIDHQVKIRGFRIELGEIEAELLEMPAIKEAVVIAREDVPGDKRLVAYWVAAPEDAVDDGALRAGRAQTLPEHMIPAAVDEAALEQAFNGIVRRHENLRTVFVSGNAGPSQVILPGLALSVARVDLTGLPERDRPEILRNLRAREAPRPFSLAAGPLLRLTLITVSGAGGQRETCLLVTLRHGIADGWSATILMREFAALYRAFSRGVCSPLPELPVQYADFACRQRRPLAAGKLRQQAGYWRAQPDGIAAGSSPARRHGA